MIRRGFTLVEAFVIMAVIVLIVVVLMTLVQSRARKVNRQLSDSTQLRGLLQACSAWSMNDRHQRFPLPSDVDASNHTVAAPGAEKNTTANVFSILVFQMMITPELLVSPDERGKVYVYEGYEYARPSAAIEPSLALWDPALSADFAGVKSGNVSYAHLQPSAGRLSRWSNSVDAAHPVLSNRGPHIAGVSPSIVLGDPTSITLTNGKWRGNAAYSDHHVSFENGYGDPADNRFFDEPADPANAYLGIFIKAGKEAGDFTAIWD